VARCRAGIVPRGAPGPVATWIKATSPFIKKIKKNTKYSVCAVHPLPSKGEKKKEKIKDKKSQRRRRLQKKKIKVRKLELATFIVYTRPIITRGQFATFIFYARPIGRVDLLHVATCFS
jgi:hypothetical protein